MNYHVVMSTQDPSTRPPRREREQARHRRDILAVAVDLFANNGYHQTTMQMIAERAEFSVGYLYKHFSGKEEIYQELVVFHVARIDELIAAVNARNLPPLDDLRASFEAISTHFNEHPGFMRIYHQEIGTEYCQMLETKQRHYEEIVQTISRAQKAGDLAPFDPKLLAAAIQGTTKELLGELSGRAGDAPFDEFTDTIFSLLIDPLRK
jgi:TetR/AcrR family transcriptional regulator